MTFYCFDLYLENEMWYEFHVIDFWLTEEFDIHFMKVN